jgi:O-antigen/teichoic acid export membrane protein
MRDILIYEKFQKKESIIQELKPIAIIVLLMVICEILIIISFGETLFNIAFGKRNIYSGNISKILVWSYALNFCAASFSSLFIAMKKIKYQSIWQIFYFISILSLIFFKKINFESFLEIYVTIEVFCSIMNIFLIILILRKYEKQISINSSRH